MSNTKALPVGTQVGADTVLAVLEGAVAQIKFAVYLVRTGCCNAEVQMQHKTLLKRAAEGVESCRACRNNGRAPTTQLPKAMRAFKVTQPNWPVTTAGHNAPR